MKKSLIAAALVGASFAPAAAMAQEAPETAAPDAAAAPALTVGATVYGPENEVVGTIEEVTGGNVVVFTGANRATLPANAFATSESGPLISMTKAQLDAAVEAAAAQNTAAMDAALVAGAPVNSRDGVLVGTVQNVEGDNVTIDLTEGDAVTLQTEHMTADQAGLKLFMTAEEFNAAVSAAGQQPAEAASAPVEDSAAPAAPVEESASTPVEEAAAPPEA